MDLKMHVTKAAKILRCNEGAGVIEYGLMVIGTVAVVAGAYEVLKTAQTTLFTRVSTTIAASSPGS